MPSEAAIQQVWIASLVIYFVVVAIVALFLTLIWRTAHQIHGGVSAIWTVGQKVANNTIQIPLLARTNFLLARTLESAVRTAGAVGAIEQHAGDCTHCPACVLGSDRRS